MILDNPGPQKPELEYIRQNRPFYETALLSSFDL